MEGYDGHLFKDVDQVIDHYYGGDILTYPSTILEAFEYALENSDGTERTKNLGKQSVRSFERFILSNPQKYGNFSIIRKAPKQMYRAHVIDYANYMKEKGLEQTSMYYLSLIHI